MPAVQGSRNPAHGIRHAARRGVGEESVPGGESRAHGRRFHEPQSSYRETLGNFQARKIDILVGTQMIAKGLHFPNVTLVGIVNADVGLHMADFRAGERTFQLLTQVAGRAGRGEAEGEVLVQTFTPSHPSIQHARHHDFAGFWSTNPNSAARLGIRHFSDSFSSRCAATTPSEQRSPRRRSLALREAADGDMIVAEPSPAPLARVKSEYRFHLSMKSPSAVRMSRVIKATLAN